jgi:MFS family permease
MSPFIERKQRTGVEQVARQASSSYRWFVLCVLLATQLLIQSSLYGPAALAIQMRQHLGITNAQFGFAMGLANLATTLTVVLSSLSIDRYGVAKTFSCGMVILGAGGIGMVFAHQLSFLLASRVLQGFGIGIIYPAAAALIMDWFPLRELTYINTSFIGFAFVGGGLAYISTAAMLRWGAEWTTVLLVYGLLTMIAACIWALFGCNNRDRDGRGLRLLRVESRGSSLRKAAAMPTIWLLGIGLCAARSVAETYLFFLPMYLQKERLIAQSEAAHTASLFPFASVAGVLLFGMLAKRVDFQKHLLWVTALVVLVGSVPVAFGSYAELKWGLVIIGCGVAGIQPVQSTYLMSLPKVTPSIIAAFFVITNLLTHIGGFIAPFAAGRLSETVFGLKHTLFLFSLVEVAGILALVMVPPSAPRTENTLDTGEPI